MNYPRRLTRISYEGISFVSVLSFIVLGSIIRQINLLVLLSGLMIAPFFFSWRISMKMIERVWVARVLPDYVPAASSFWVRWRIGNDRSRIPTWGLKIVDQICLTRLPVVKSDKTDVRVGKPGKKSRTEDTEQATVLVPAVGAGKRLECSYRCFAPVRGIYKFGPAKASSAFPIGLIRSTFNHSQMDHLIVTPPVGKLTKAWNQLIHGKRTTDVASRKERNQQQGDFYAIRAWQSGDSPRQVHWRSSARHGELMVRQLEQPTDDRPLLVLDLYGGKAIDQNNAYSITGTVAPADVALSFFSTIAIENARSRRPPKMAIIGDQTFTIDAWNRSSVKQLMNCLATVHVEEGQGIVHELETLRILGQAGRVIVISTRSKDSLVDVGKDHEGSALFSAATCHWIDVTNDKVRQWFSMPTGSISEFVMQAVDMKNLSRWHKPDNDKATAVDSGEHR